MYRADGSRAPKELVRGDPPGIPGKPRPALLPGEARLGPKRLVVVGVIIFAEIPFACGAPSGRTGETTAGTCCWAESPPEASWADPVDHPPSKLKQVAANMAPIN